MASSVCSGSARGEKVRFSLEWQTLTIWYGRITEVVQCRNVIAIVNAAENTSGEKFYNILQVCENKGFPASGSRYTFDSVLVTGLPDAFLERHIATSRPPHLHIPFVEGVTPLRIIVSIGSGSGEANDFFTNVVRPAFAAYGFKDDSFHVHYTDSERSVTEFAEEVLLPCAQRGCEQTVLLLSGDGGIADLVNTFQPAAIRSNGASRDFKKPTVGLVAMGSGNALANSTGINADATRGLRHFFRGSPKALPTFCAKFSKGSELVVGGGKHTEPLPSRSGDEDCVYGAVVFSWALHASLVANSDTAEYRKHGVKRFQMAANELLGPFDRSAPHIYQGRIELVRNGKAKSLQRSQWTYVLATLVSNLQEGFNISPHSKPLDGQLRILLLGTMPSIRVKEILGEASKDGAHIDDPSVAYNEIDGLRIIFEELEAKWRRVCIDGKIIQVGLYGWVKVSMCKESFLNLLLMH